MNRNTNEKSKKMGMFSGMAQAKASARGEYFQPGEYVCKVEKICMVKSQNSGDLYTAEFEVLESNNPSTPVGSRRTLQIKMSLKSALGNIKAFLGPLNGIDVSDATTLDKEITEEVAEVSIDETLNADFLGKKVAVSVSMQPTKEDKAKDKALGNPNGTTRSFSAHNFRPCEQ